MSTSTWPGPEPDKAWALGCYMDKLSACGAIICPRVITDEGAIEFLKQKKRIRLSDTAICTHMWLFLRKFMSDEEISEIALPLFDMIQMVQDNKLQDLPDEPLWVCDDFQRGKVKTKPHRDLLLVGYFLDFMIHNKRVKGFDYVLDHESDAMATAQTLLRKGFRVNPEDLPNLMDQIYKVAWMEHKQVPVAVNLSLAVSLLQHCCFDDY